MQKNVKLINAYPQWADPNEGAIFNDLKNISGVQASHPWLAKADELDFEYIGNRSGDKPISTIISRLLEGNSQNANPKALTSAQRTLIAKMVINRFGFKWSKLYAVQSAEYNPINNYDMVEEETPDISRKYKVSNDYALKNERKSKTDYSVSTDGTSNNSTYGFNSNSPIPSDDNNSQNVVRTQGDLNNNVTQDEQTQTGYREETESGKRTLTRSGNIGVTSSQQLLESEINLWNWEFFESVFTDIDSVLASPIYGFLPVIPDLLSQKFTHNGKYYARAYGADGFSLVEVDVHDGAVLISKTINENGEYRAVDYDADGFSTVIVDVVPDLGELTVTENGEYLPATIGKEGFSKVTVAVPVPVNKFTSLVDGSIIEVTTADLSGITVIKQGAFDQCRALTSLTLPSTITTIGQNAFNDCILLSRIIIPNSVTSIGNSAFRNCAAATELVISNALTEIPYGCFQYCSAVANKVVIPASVTSIKNYAFYGDRSIPYFVVLQTTPPTLESTAAFSTSNANCMIYCPTPDAYRLATNWLDIAGRIFPLVATIADLSNIDTATYTKACVTGADFSYKEYAWDGSEWNEVTTRSLTRSDPIQEFNIEEENRK